MPSRRSTWPRGEPRWARTGSARVRRTGVLLAVLVVATVALGGPQLAGAQAPSRTPSTFNQTVILPPEQASQSAPAQPAPQPAGGATAAAPCVGTCLAPVNAAATATPLLVTTATPPAALLTNTVRDVAILSGGVAPITGTVTFRLYSDPLCTVEVFSSTNPVVADALLTYRATSNPYNVVAAGVYHWVATYSGDANNTPTGPTLCLDPAETLVVAKNSPVLATIAQPRTATVGSQLRDQAFITGAFAPTGTVTFTLYSDPNCTVPVFTSTDPVDPVAATAISKPYTVTQPGTYHWIATYSGDVNNNPIGPGSCSNLNEQVVVTGTAASTTTSTSSTSSTSTSTSTTSTTTSTSTTSTTVPTGTTTSSTSSTSTTSSTVTPSTTTSTTAPSTTTLVGSTTTSTTTSISTSTSTSVPGSTSTSVPTSTSTTAAPPPLSTSTTSVPTATTPTMTTPAAPGTTTSTTMATTTSTTMATTITIPGGGTVVPSLTASPQVLAPGESATVTGTGFPPNRAVLVQLFSDPVTLGTTTADAFGTFRLVVTIPVGTRPGVHTLVATGLGGFPRAEAPLTVSAQGGLLGLASQVLKPLLSPFLTPAVVGTVILARTGSDVAWATRLALVLVALGFSLVLLAWRWERAAAFSVRQPWPRSRGWKG